MDLTQSEFEILLKLKQLKQNKKYIALSLYPPIGNSTIQKENNRMFINEGRDGKWQDISESFYDSIAEIYDSRS
jgi:hypothetical protein